MLAVVHSLLHSVTMSAATALRKRDRYSQPGERRYSGLQYQQWLGRRGILLVKLIAVASFYAFIISVPILSLSYLHATRLSDRVETRTGTPSRWPSCI